jgi:MFS family permease
LRALAAAAAVAALSALVVAPAPSYDPWAWLLWGREVAGLGLSTAEGPAFKPLPVAVCALLSALGGAAPVAWVIIARTGAVLAVWLGFRLGRGLAAGSTIAGLLAAAGVALCGGFLGYAAAGAETGWVIAFGLAAAEAWRAGRFRLALACGVACALLRVEAWPFILAAGAILWRRRPQDRPLLAACAVAVPALWFVPEWLGSGDLLRSGSRARIPNPGQPATADFPAASAVAEAFALLLWPLWVGAGVAWVRLPAARIVLGCGVAWIGLVAAMAQAGFSGEPRYSLPGGALVAIAGAAGLVELVRALGEPRVRDAARRRGAEVATACVAGAVLLAAAAPKLADLPQLRRDQAWARGLAADLPGAIRAAGGREAVLACGRPYVGDLRGPLLAYHLDVEKRRVAFRPRPPGVVFGSRLHPGAAVEPPAAEAFAPVARSGRWEVSAAC